MEHLDRDDADLVRACTRKKAYASEEYAKISVAAIRRADPGAEVRVYSCRRCGQWHVGGIPYVERRPGMEDVGRRDEWDAEMARRRSHGGRRHRGGRGQLYSHRISRQPRRPPRDREER